MGIPTLAGFFQTNQPSGERIPPSLAWRLRVNPNHALAAGLVTAWPDCLGTTGDRLTGKNRLTENSTLVGAQGTEFGQVATFNGNSTSRCDASGATDFTSTTGSASIWMRLDATPGAQTGFYGYSDTATTPNGVGFLVNTTPTLRIVIAQNISNKIALVGNTLTVGRWTHCGVVFRPAGSQCEAYQDGVQIATGTSPTGFGFPAGAFPSIGVNVGVAGDSGTGGCSCACCLAFWWSRALTPQEMGVLYAKPWCMFEPSDQFGTASFSGAFDASVADSLHLNDAAEGLPFTSDRLVLTEGFGFIPTDAFGNVSDSLRFGEEFRVDSATLGNRRYRR